MHTVALFLAAAAATAPVVSAPATAPTLAANRDLDAVVGAMQKTYENTQDFRASFTQKYTNALFRRTTESKGIVQFKKPGLMRWDYEQPSTKSFVVDGKALWVYQAEDKTALVDRCFKQDGLTASVAFLWGAGDIREQFDVARFAGTFGEKTDDHLELTPKEKNGVFAKLILVLDPKSHRVKQSIVVDPQGNVNQFIYDDVTFNGGLGAKSFTFTPPKGAHVARIPGSCDAPAQGG